MKYISCESFFWLLQGEIKGGYKGCFTTLHLKVRFIGKRRKKSCKKMEDDDIHWKVNCELFVFCMLRHSK